MNLLVVTPGSGWVLDTIGRSVAQAGGWAWMQHDGSVEAMVDATMATSWTTKVDPRDAEAVLYWDAQCCWGESWRDLCPKAVHVGAFTHADRDDLATVREHLLTLDGVVHMAQRYHDRFLESGWYPAERMIVIRPGQVNGFRLRPLRLGVCQRGGFPGKGDPFLFEALAGLPAKVRRHVELRIKGSGWRPSLVEHLDRLAPMRVELDETEAAPDYERFHHGIDYLLVPSLWEGGPMAVQEALACGVPVIAADVGLVPDLLGQAIADDCYHASKSTGSWVFPAGDGPAMRSIIEWEVEERSDRRRRVDSMSWKSYAEKLEAFVETLR